MKKVSGRAIKALILAALMVSVLCVTAFAASCRKSVTTGRSTQTFTITTGSGWQYSLGWKKTTVTVKNTGSTPVYVYNGIGSIGYAYNGQLNPGQSKTYTASGSGKRYYYMIQRSRGTGSVTITTSAGSVW